MLLNLQTGQLDITKRPIFLLPQVSFQDETQELSFNLTSLQIHLEIACIGRGVFIPPTPWALQVLLTSAFSWGQRVCTDLVPAPLLGQTLHIAKSTCKALGSPMAWLGVMGSGAERTGILTGLANRFSKAELLTERKDGRMGLDKFLIFALFSGLLILTRHLVSF